MAYINGKTIKFAVKSDPLPQQSMSAGRKYEWPFATMKVGECFYFPIDGKGVIASSRARSKISRAAILHRVTGKRFVTRAMPDDKHIGVWRIV